MRSNRKLISVVSSILIGMGTSAQAQAPATTPPCSGCAVPGQIAPQPRPFQIHFFAPIDYNTINQLIGLIDQQLKAGTKDIYILLSSPGGDPSAAYAAYSYLHGVNANITTFNLGNVDSAANLIYCAGKVRYALPGTRFLIHGASYGPPPGTSLDGAGLDAQSAQIKNLNEMMVHVLGSVTKNRQSELDLAVHGQKILGADEAKEWGLVQQIKSDFVVPGAVLASIDPAPAQPSPVLPGTFTSISGDSITGVIP